MSELIDQLHQELMKAQSANLIPYFHMTKIAKTFQNTPYDNIEYSDSVDLYVGINVTLIEKEFVLKRYLRKKYGSIIRVLVVETY